MSDATDKPTGQPPSLQALCDLLRDYCQRHGLPYLDAAELFHHPDVLTNGTHYWWLRAFERLWNLTQDSLR